MAKANLYKRVDQLEQDHRIIIHFESKVLCDFFGLKLGESFKIDRPSNEKEVLEGL